MKLHRCYFLFAGFALFLGAAGAAPAQEKLPPGTKLLRIEARPGSIALKSPYDYSQLILSGQLDSGDKIDVTRMAQVQAPANVKASPNGIIRPVSDGQGSVKCSVAGQTIDIPVKVAGLKDKVEVSFIRDVMPVLSKVGCNAGTCHGAQSGKNGFKLSLRGYDALFDHRALTDDHGGRRFNRAAPDRSLMLLKPAGGVPHVGGVLFQPGDPYYELIKNWIAQGVKYEPQAPRVTSIEIFPKSAVLPLPGMKQQTAVLATFSDGLVRDVTAEAFIESSNTEVATADKQGLITAVRRGEATMLARYEGNYTAAGFLVMGDRSGFVWKETPEFNAIDTLVYEKLKQVKILPSELCTDAEFVRRLYLDLTGLPPQPDDVRKFLADPRATRVKRDDLVDKLVGNADFVEHWTNKWADLLQVNRKFVGEKSAVALRSWIRQAVATNMPYDKFAYAVLTGSGSTLENPPAAYYKILREPGPVMENTTQLFLAIRFNCNKCHDHPFERWTQDQYYQMAAFFAQIGHKEDPHFRGKKVGGTDVMGALPEVEIISDQSAGEVKHDRTGVVTPPVFPYKIGEPIPAKGARRERLARWTTSKENPYFAKSYVNRIWSYLLGVGLIEPIDDIRAGNPPSNPKLLDRMSDDFIKSGFNVQELMRAICKSRVYQHSIVTNQWNLDDEVNYSHALARRLPAEVLFDAIHRATGSVTVLAGQPRGIRAAQLLDSSVEVPSGFLDLFGKPARESACECERSGSMMLGPVLNLVNGPIVGDALKDPDNRIAKLIAAQKDDRKVIEELFLSLVCRPPTEKEIQNGLEAFRKAGADFDQLTTEYNELQAALAGGEKSLAVRQAVWEKNPSNVVRWTILEPTEVKAAKGATLTKQPDKSVLASGTNSTPESYTVTINTNLNGITGFRLEAMTDPSLPGKGPGRGNGNFVLTEFKVMAAPQKDPKKAAKVVFSKAIADFSQEGLNVLGAIDEEPLSGWGISPQQGKPHVALFEAKQPINIAGGATLTITLDHQFVFAKQHNLGRFRISATTVKGPVVSLEGPPDSIITILDTPAAKRTKEQQAELATYYRAIDPELKKLTQALAEHAKPPVDKRLLGAQDLAWALINSPAFLFNH